MRASLTLTRTTAPPITSCHFCHVLRNSIVGAGCRCNGDASSSGQPGDCSRPAGLACVQGSRTATTQTGEFPFPLLITCWQSTGKPTSFRWFRLSSTETCEVQQSCGSCAKDPVLPSKNLALFHMSWECMSELNFK